MSNSTTNPQVTADKAQDTPAASQQQKRAALEEDDEFEDFPVEGKRMLLPIC
jgi:hypothetical protein